MLRTKFKYENKQRAITKKKKIKKSYGFCRLHSSLMRSIHPQNFITIACIVLEICTGQNLSIKNQRAITQRLSKQELRFMCTALPLDEIYPPTKFQITKIKKSKQSYRSCALHSPLKRSIHSQNFITIASINLEICSGQNSSMKINKGQ